MPSILKNKKQKKTRAHLTVYVDRCELLLSVVIVMKRKTKLEKRKFFLVKNFLSKNNSLTFRNNL